MENHSLDPCDYPTIENRWDILYSQFPKIYERFSLFPKTPKATEMIPKNWDMAGKDVVDVGCGAGKSLSFFAQYAGWVFGIEPEEEMRKLAVRNCRAKNVTIFEGSADSIPLIDASADFVTHVTAPINPEESLRVLRTRGTVVLVGISPGWYGGHLGYLIGHQEFDIDQNQKLIEKGFQYFDIDSVQEYGSSENIIETYGFIFGRKVINHLLESRETSIRWRFRIHHRQK